MNDNMSIHQVLKRYWGYDNFRPLQEEIINSILSNRDTVGLMPTGGGKSITFQVPALAQDGICIVITPLISLMKDQVDNLRALDIKAAYIHSGMTRHEMNITLDNSLYGNYKFLYVSPERLKNYTFIEMLKRMTVSMVVVDEAHCISQWGYDFRPSYMNIADIRKIKPEIPILALTATATKEVVEDIKVRLDLKDAAVFTMSFMRKNISYVVRETENKIAEIAHILSRVKGSSIVYVRNRKRTREIAVELQKYGYTVEFFHAGVNVKDKNYRQQLWKDGTYRVIVATNAFGMGIDKPDVRTVIHFDLPNSPEEYYQEAGRAGRDGEKSYAIILYNANDKTKLIKRISNSFPSKDYIKQVYNAVCDYMVVAVGSGEGEIKEFNLAIFCDIFKLPIIDTHSALKIIELCGYIEYVESVDTAPRVMIIVDREELYHWRARNEKEEQLLECIMRSYSGLFTEYAYINEELLSRRSGLTTDDIYKILVSLSKDGIIHYIPRKVNPYIYMAQPREESGYFRVSKHIYEERKERFTKRIEKMIEYATHDKKCRQEILLNYFDEKIPSPCGICDNCISNRAEELSSNDFKRVEQHIKSQLQEKPQNITYIVETSPYNKESTIEVLRFLVDEGVIVLSDTLYSLR